MIPRSDIDAVKERVDIGDLIMRYGVELKTSGIGLKGLCPFHDESTPSFNVRPSTGTYHCFGCGESGDAFSFVQKKEGLEFADAVRMIAEQLNVELHETGQDEEESGPNKRRLFAALAAAAEFYRAKYQELPHNHVARTELRKRNLEVVDGRPDWLDEFGIGYAPEGWTHLYEHLTAKGYTFEELSTAGLIGTSNSSGKIFDFFRGRLTWEIRDIQGRVVGFGARKLYESDNGPKYLNSGDTPLYRKSNVLYGLDLARKSVYDKKTIFVVEGYTDVMASAAVGVTNVVAASGTAFGDGHAHTVRRLMGDSGRFVFFFDADEAGQKAARKTFDLSAPIHSNSYVCVAEGGDPCDIRLANGDEALLQQVASENQVPLTQFILKSEQALHDMATSEGRSNFLDKAVGIVQKISVLSLREDYIRKITFWSGSDINTVRSLVEQANRGKRPAAEHPEDPQHRQGQAEQKGSRKQQEALLALGFQYPARFYKTLETTELDPDEFDSDLSVVALELWMLLKNTRGSLDGATHDDFSEPETVTALIHRPFPLLDRQPLDQVDEAVARMIRTFLRAITAFRVHERAANIQARVNASYDDTRSHDETFLQEIEEAQRAAGIVRRKRNKRR